MLFYVVPLAIILLSLPLLLSLARANELFVLRWDGRELQRVRGRVPPRLRTDLADVLGNRRGPPTPGGVQLRVVVESERPAVHVRGDVAPELRQRLRNILATWPVARIRALAR